MEHAWVFQSMFIMFTVDIFKSFKLDYVYLFNQNKMPDATHSFFVFSTASVCIFSISEKYEYLFKYFIILFDN